MPQDSILRPLLFFLHINDTVYVSSLLFTILYADDSEKILTRKNFATFIDIMNKELSKIKNGYIQIKYLLM